MIFMKKYLELKNFSTILTSILLTLFGLLIGYATSRGINLPFNAEIATSITSGAILFAFSYYNAKHHNDLFDEETDTIYIPIDNLTDEQIDTINNMIDKAISENINDEIEQIDPALEYEEIVGESDGE